MSTRRAAILLVASLVGLAALGVVLAQSSTNFDLSWNVLGGGGGGSSSANFDLGGTVGQTAPGTSMSSGFRLDAGFWPGVAAPAVVPTPTPTPGPGQFGDVDCNGSVDAVDSLKILRYVAGLSVSQTEPCPDIGSAVPSVFGDVDCNGSVDAVDALKALRYVAGLSVSQTEPCPDIGSSP